MEISHAKRLHPVVTIGTAPSTFKDLHYVKCWLGLKVLDAEYWIFFYFQFTLQGKVEQEKQRPASTSCNTLLPSPTPVSGLRWKGERAALIDSVTLHHAKCVEGWFIDSGKWCQSFVWKLSVRPAVSSLNSVSSVYDHAFTVLHLLCSPHSALDLFPCIQTVPQQLYVDATAVDLSSFHFVVLLQLLLKSKSTVRYRVGVEPSVVLRKGHVGHGTIEHM